MSAFFGYIDFYQLINGDALLNTMQNPMLYWGKHGKHRWVSSCAAFGLLQTYNTPESVEEKFPLTDETGKLLFFFVGRIDNRTELINRLSDNIKLSGDIVTDSDLVFSAYLFWGKQCVDYLVGDWAFFVWDKLTQELFLTRDQHGTMGIYYYYDRDRFVFSSSLKGLLAIPDIPKIKDELYVAMIVACWHSQPSQTAYKDLKRIPPAHSIEVGKSHFRMHRYWYLERTPEHRYSNERDYFDQFMELYQEAVRCRLRSYGKVASKLSAGLDSGSVAVLAANLMKENSQTLRTYTSVPLYPDHIRDSSRRFGNESELAMLTARINGNIDPLLVNAAQYRIVDVIHNALFIHDEPLHASGNLFWIHAIDQLAVQEGVSSLLSGQHGNATVSWPLPGEFEKRVASKSASKYWNQIRNLTLAKVYHRLFRPYLPGERLVNKSPLSREIRNLIFYSGIDLSNRAYYKGKADYLHARQYSVIRPGVDKFLCLAYERGGYSGLEHRDPTADRRLMEFIVSVPTTFFEKQKIDRVFIKTCFKGLMPDEVLFNTRRGLQAADLVWRVTADEKAEIRDTLFKNKDWFESKLIRKMDDWQQGKEISHIEAVVLLRAYMGMKFWEYSCKSFS